MLHVNLHIKLLVKLAVISACMNFEFQQIIKMNWSYKKSCYAASQLDCHNEIQDLGYNLNKFAPFYAALGYKRKQMPVFKVACGGALITKNMILTAAHCFDEIEDKKNIRELSAAMGCSGIQTEFPCRQYRDIVEVWIHKKYVPNTFHNDIAIVETLRPFELKGYVRLIRLPPYPENQETGNRNQVCLTAGMWERTYDSQLHFECVRIANNSRCHVSSKQGLCVDVSSTFFKEDGSPLFCYNGRHFVLTGFLITMIRDPIGGVQYPALYGRILDFVNSTLVRLSAANKH